MGLSELIATSNDRPMDYTEVGKLLQNSLKEMMQARQMHDLAEVVKTLTSSDPSTRPEPVNPFAVLKDVGFDVQKMVEVNQKVAESALEQAEKERARRLEEERLALQAKQQQYSQELSLAEKLVQLQQAHSDKVLDLQRQMYESKLQERNQPDPLNEQLNQIMVGVLAQSLKERLTPSNQNPLDQIQTALQLTSQLGKMFGNNGNESQRWQMELEKMKFERQIELEREKLQMQKEEAERRTKNFENLMNQLTGILPSVVQAMRGSPSVPPPAGASTGVEVAAVSAPADSAVPPVTASSPEPPTAVEIICPNCGENFQTMEVNNPTCPHCHTSLIRKGVNV